MDSGTGLRERRRRVFRIGDLVRIKLSGDEQTDYDIRRRVGKEGRIKSINLQLRFPYAVKIDGEFEPVELKKEEMILVEAKEIKKFGITKFWEKINV